MHKKTIRKLLKKYGWITDENCSDSVVLDAVEQYQKFFRLKPDRDPGPITQMSLAEPRICELPDRLEQIGTHCRWQKALEGRKVTWTVAGSIPGISATQFRNVVQNAFSFWTKVSNIHFEFVDRIGDADIVFRTGGISGRQTLGWAQLPCSATDRQLETRYNTNIQWVIAINPPAGRFDLFRVLLHEIGHLLGIGHLSPGNILQPTYTNALRELQSGDINEAVKRYGPPTIPDPDPDPEESEVEIGGITVNGVPGKLVFVPDE